MASRLEQIPGLSIRFLHVNPIQKPGLLERLFLVSINWLMPGNKELQLERPSPNEGVSTDLPDILLDPCACPATVPEKWPSSEIIQIQIDNRPALHPLAGLRAWTSGDEVTRARLVELKSGKTLATRMTRTFLTSWPKHSSRVLSMVMDMVEDFMCKGAETPTGFTGKSPEYEYSDEHDASVKGTIPIITAILATGSRIIQKAAKRLFRDERWILGLGPQATVEAEGLPALKELVPPRNCFWADPFIVSEAGKSYIFIEELPLATGRGHLSCVPLDENGKAGKAVRILEKPYHLSYPNVFMLDEKWYMIPESSENLTVDLYECEGFPFKWIHRKTLLSGIRAFDSTLLWHNGKVWLFCTVCRHPTGSPDDNLHIFYSDNLLNGAWIPHRMNPVKSNPYNSRPAGAFWRSGDDILRPAQRGVPAYGSATVVNKLTALDETSFSETTVKVLLPEKGYSAMHTLNRSSDRLVVDLIGNRLKLPW